MKYLSSMYIICSITINKVLIKPSLRKLFVCPLSTDWLKTLFTPEINFLKSFWNIILSRKKSILMLLTPSTLMNFIEKKFPYMSPDQNFFLPSLERANTQRWPYISIYICCKCRYCLLLLIFIIPNTLFCLCVNWSSLKIFRFH